MTSAKESDVEDEEEEVPKLKARSNSEPREIAVALADMVDDIENAGINGGTEKRQLREVKKEWLC